MSPSTDHSAELKDVGEGPQRAVRPIKGIRWPRLCKGRYLRIAAFHAWRGKSYRAGSGVNVGFSHYEPMIAHLQRMSANRPL
jgi:hypothetical protein